MSDPAVVIRLDTVTRRLAVPFVALAACGGVALIVVAGAGLAIQTDSQRMYTVLGGSLLIAFAILTCVGLSKPQARLTLDEHGFSVWAPDSAFALRWAETRWVAFSREKQMVGRSTMWSYHLEWCCAVGSPDYQDFRRGDSDSYIYSLGRLGAGRRLYSAVRRFAPGTVQLWK